jgi:hypothetical protein
MAKPELRLVHIWSKPLSNNENLPSVTHPHAYDQQGFPVVQTCEILAVTTEPVALPFFPEDVRVRVQLPELDVS